MAIKRQWQFGLIALAFTGVSTYNFVFFKSYSAGGSTKAPTGTAAPISAQAPVAEISEQASGSQFPLSLEDLRMQAQFAFKPSSESESELYTRLASRDPFSNTQEPAHATPSFEPKPKNTVSAIQANPPAEIIPPEPQCAFSGTLIDSDRRLALVDGTPVSIGAPISGWRLARIETGYIILQSGKTTRRIELTTSARQVAQKEF
jgi:hypothetical protein